MTTEQPAAKDSGLCVYPPCGEQRSDGPSGLCQVHYDAFEFVVYALRSMSIGEYPVMGLLQVVAANVARQVEAGRPARLVDASGRKVK